MDLPQTGERQKLAMPKSMMWWYKRRRGSPDADAMMVRSKRQNAKMPDFKMCVW